MKQSLVHIALLSTILTLGGCGGSGGSDNNSNENNDKTNQQIKDNVWLVEGIVQDANSRYIESAKISVVLNNVEYSTLSNKSGEYELELPKEFNYPEYLSGIIYAEGYKPKTLLLSYENNQLSIDEESNNPIINKLQEQDVIFFNGLKVIHLGDDNFSGSANSQFQIKAEGNLWKDSFIYSAAKKAKYNEICISLTGKGIQSSTIKDTISLSRNGESGTFINQLLKDSSELGSYSNLEHCFSLQSFKADDQIELRIQSGNTGNDYDDFEIINIEGVFKNSTISSSGNSVGSNNGGSDNSSGSGGNSNLGGSDNSGSGNSSGSGGNSGSGGSSNTALCTSSATVQCVGKDNINYLGGGFNSYTGNIGGYVGQKTGDSQQAYSCSVVRSGNTLEIMIPSLGVSAKVVGESLNVVTLAANDSQSLFFPTTQNPVAGGMTNSYVNGKLYQQTTIYSGSKTYYCSRV